MNKKVLVATVLVLPMTLGGCFLPAPVSYMLLAADGFSFVSSGKSVSDHALSALVEKDCAMLNVLTEGEVCLERGQLLDTPDEGGLVAMAPPKGEIEHDSNSELVDVSLVQTGEESWESEWPRPVEQEGLLFDDTILDEGADATDAGHGLTPGTTPADHFTP